MRLKLLQQRGRRKSRVIVSLLVFMMVLMTITSGFGGPAITVAAERTPVAASTEAAPTTDDAKDVQTGNTEADPASEVDPVTT